MQHQLLSPLDMHIHFRDGDLMRLVVPHTAQAFAGAVAMPNLVPAVDSLEGVLSYREQLLAATQGAAFEPFMTLFMRDFSEAELARAKPHIIAVKLYPDGITTNSSGGVRSFEEVEAVLARMESLDIPLMVHGETHGFVLEREWEFAQAYYKKWAQQFPKLRITMEHVTDRRTLSLLDSFENLAATVTVHHLLLCLDDLIGGALQPHHFCKPIVKTPADRQALQAAVTSGHPRIFFGSDSAPHPAAAKLNRGAAGCYTAPVALPLLAELFEQHNCLDKLQAFVRDNATGHYRLSELPDKTTTLEKQSWEVPAAYHVDSSTSVIPFKAGETLPWKVLD
jgi:dihydroorotase